LTGAVETVVEPVAGLTTARLKSLKVTRGQRVNAGEVVAEMDTDLIRAQLAIDEATVHEAETTVARFQRDVLLFIGRFQGELDNAEATLAEEQLRVEREKAELEGLRREQARMQALLKQRLVREQDIRDVRAQIAALEKSVEESPKVVAVHQQTVTHARERLAEARRWLRLEEGEDASAAIARKMEARGAIFELTRRMGELQLSTCSLKATRDGIVSRIFHEEGDVVPAGEPILRLVAPTSMRIIGFLPEQYVGDLQVGRRGVARPHSGNGANVPVVIESISPEVSALPGRVSPIRGQSIRGRRVVFSILDENHGLVPGQTVRIHDAEAEGIGARLRRWVTGLFSTSSEGE
jgi:multidrug resistance efflux pump